MSFGITSLTKKKIEEVILLIKLWRLQRFSKFRGRCWDSISGYHEYQNDGVIVQLLFRYAATGFVDQFIRYLRIALVRGVFNAWPGHQDGPCPWTVAGSSKANTQAFDR